MTVSEKHIAAAIDLVDSETFKGLMAVDRIGKCAEMIAAALAAAEREGREDERRRCIRELRDELVEIYEDSPEIDVECNNLIRRVEGCILSQANTHSVALLPPGATEAGSVQPSADPATHHASRDGRGEQ